MKEMPDEIMVAVNLYGGLYVSNLVEAVRGLECTRYVRADLVADREKFIEEVWEKYKGGWLSDSFDDRDDLWQAITKFMEAKEAK